MSIKLMMVRPSASSWPTLPDANPAPLIKVPLFPPTASLALPSACHQLTGAGLTNVAPSLVDGGKEADFQILIDNKNPAPLQQADLVIASQAD